MRILYFATTTFYSRPNPSFHLMYGMIADLLEAGHTVNYVGIKRLDLDKHIPDEFLQRPNFHCRFIDLKPGNRKNFVRRYLRGIKYALKAKKHLKFFAPQSDVIFLQSSPTVLYNVLIARSCSDGKPLIWNVQDMFPGSSIASGVMKSKLLQKIFFGLQKIAYRKSDIIVGISEDMRIKLQEQGVPDEKIRVILNWYDDKAVHYVPWDENRFVKKYNMTHSEFYVQYAGTMGYVFDYKAVLNVAEQLRQRTDIVIQMIGAGSQKEAFMREANDRGLTNIRFYPLEPQEMVSDVYSACDVCFIPLKHGIIGNSVPSKAGLLMACHKPIVTSVDDGCEYAKEINENGIGIACPDNQNQLISDAILKLADNRDICQSMGEKGYEYGKQLYSRTENMKLYIQLFEEVANGTY